MSHTSSSHKQPSADYKKRNGIGEGKGAGKRYTLPGEGKFVCQDVVATWGTREWICNQGCGDPTRLKNHQDGTKCF